MLLAAAYFAQPDAAAALAVTPIFFAFAPVVGAALGIVVAAAALGIVVVAAAVGVAAVPAVKSHVPVLRVV